MATQAPAPTTALPTPQAASPSSALTRLRGAAPRLFDVGSVVVLLVIALTGLVPAWSASQTASAAGLGLVIGIALALAGARWKLSTSTVAVGAVLGYLLLTGPVIAPATMIAGVVPTPATAKELALAAVRSWRDSLTLLPPFDGRPSLSAVPVLLGLLGAVVAVSLALRLRRPWWVLIPVAAVLVGSALMGSREASWLLPRGALLALVTFGWAAWRGRRARPESAVGINQSADSAEAGASSRRWSALAVLAVAVAAGSALAPVTATETPRFVLRDQMVPPFDLKDFASPLQSFRGYVRDHEENVLLSVDGLPAGARIRLATMDGFDGVVYDVTEGEHGASFVPSPSLLPLGRSGADDDGELATSGQEAEVTVTIGEYSGVWVPTIGEPRELTFAGERAEDQQDSLYFDAETRVALTTAALAQGDSFTLRAVIPVEPNDEQLAGKAFGQVALPEVTLVPNSLLTKAGELVGEEGDPATQARNLQLALSSTGFFSHGLEGEIPSRSGHGAERLNALVTEDQMIGDDEQYAVAMALMARSLGMPARVVMGLYPDEGTGEGGAVDLTGANLHVWTEVAFDGFGWVTYDPTPSEDQVPQDSETEPRSNPKPQVLQPPPPPEEPAQEPPVTAQDEDQEEEQDEEQAANWGWLIVVGLIALPLLIVLVPVIAVLAAKRRRARRRAQAPEIADRISGGWHEVLDAATDLGVTVPASSTRWQSAQQLSEAFATPGVTLLARRADSHVFGAGDPSEQAAQVVWAEVDGVVREMHAHVTPWQRIRARLSRRSLRAGRRARVSASRLRKDKP